MIATVAALTFGTASADEVMTKGQVTKVDEAQGNITIDHWPLKKFDMDAMTIAFRAGDPAKLKSVKSGDKVEFHVAKINGATTITKIGASPRI